METFSISCAPAGCNFAALDSAQINIANPALTTKGGLLFNAVEHVFYGASADLPEGVELNFDVTCLEGCDTVFITPSTADEAPTDADASINPKDALKLDYAVTCAAGCDKLSSDIVLPQVGDVSMDLADLQQLVKTEAASDSLLAKRCEPPVAKWVRDYCRRAAMIYHPPSFCCIPYTPEIEEPPEEDD